MPAPSSRAFCCTIRVSPRRRSSSAAKAPKRLRVSSTFIPQLSGAPNADAAEVVPFSWDTLTKEGVEPPLPRRCRTSSRASSRPSLSRTASASSTSPPPGVCSTHDNRAIYKLHDANPDCAAKLQAEAVYGSPELHAAQIKSRAPRRQPRLLRDLRHPRPRPARPRQPRRPRRSASSPTPSPASPARAKRPRPPRTSCTRPTTSPPTRSSTTATPASSCEQLQLTREQIQFTPHLLPIPRGILSTLYVRLNKACTVDELQSLLRRLLRRRPARPRAPLATPAADPARRAHQLLRSRLPSRAPTANAGSSSISCLDNLLKGAASQAVENMNLMAGFHQQEGLLDATAAVAPFASLHSA